MCVCVWERERERERESVCVWVRVVGGIIKLNSLHKNIIFHFFIDIFIFHFINQVIFLFFFSIYE